MHRILEPQALDPIEFAPFGDIIDTETQTPDLINEGHTQRFHDLAKLHLSAGSGRPSINIFRSLPASAPAIIRSMERHPLSSQAFYPLSGHPYLIAVAPPGELLTTEIRVFLGLPHQGVNYHPGVWHHYSLALNEVSDFLVVDMITNEINCDEIRLPEEEWIEISVPGQ